MTVVVAMVAVLALGGVSATSALASPEWYVKKGGVFEKLTKSHNMVGEQSFELSVPKALFGTVTVAVACKGTLRGDIAAHGVGEITTTATTIEDCRTVSGCTMIESIEGRHFPWKTELYREGSEIRQKVVSGGSGTPEWSITCKNQAGTSFELSCGTNTSTDMSNNVFGGLEGVEAKFDTKSNKTNCTLGSKESGEWKGVMKIEGEGESIKVE